MSPLLLLPLLFAGTPEADSNAMQGCPHASGFDERGDKAMGFDHEKTVHHFALTGEGGAISAARLSSLLGSRIEFSVDGGCLLGSTSLEWWKYENGRSY